MLVTFAVFAPLAVFAALAMLSLFATFAALSTLGMFGSFSPLGSFTTHGGFTGLELLTLSAASGVPTPFGLAPTSRHPDEGEREDDRHDRYRESAFHVIDLS